MGFSPEQVASFIAVLGVLSVLAQVGKTVSFYVLRVVMAIPKLMCIR